MERAVTSQVTSQSTDRRRAIADEVRGGRLDPAIAEQVLTTTTITHLFTGER